MKKLLYVFNSVWLLDSKTSTLYILCFRVYEDRVKFEEERDTK